MIRTVQVAVISQYGGTSVFLLVGWSLPKNFITPSIIGVGE